MVFTWCTVIKRFHFVIRWVCGKYIICKLAFTRIKTVEMFVCVYMYTCTFDCSGKKA